MNNLTIILLLAIGCFVVGALFLFVNAVINPDWLDWAHFAGFSMLWPLSLHCSIAIPALVLTILAIVADIVSYQRAKRSGGKKLKQLLRLWLTPLVALAGFAIGALGGIIASM